MLCTIGIQKHAGIVSRKTVGKICQGIVEIFIKILTYIRIFSLVETSEIQKEYFFGIHSI